nr:PREDICTED: adenosine receptor A2b-like [Latimeria chalumnae]|eukprot:XP_014345124.1 PREDICTED: adenosine receptor A2b-like [Latimeria chalumnae]
MRKPVRSELDSFHVGPPNSPQAMMTLHIYFVVLEVVLALGVICMNLLVCTTVYLHKELRSLTNYLIVCLAVADLGVGILAIPFSIILSMEYTLCFYLCLFMACFPLVTTQFSIFVLLVIAINTHLKIRLPQRYTIFVTKKKVMLAVALCWFLSILIGFTPMMGWNGFNQYKEKNLTLAAHTLAERSAIAWDLPYGGFLSKVYLLNRHNFSYSDIHSSHMGRCSFRTVISPAYLVYFIFFICMLAPLLTMLSIYTDLFCLVRDYFVSQSLRPAKRPETYSARTLLLLVGLFCFCWLPFHVLDCFLLFCPSCEIHSSLTFLAVLLSHLNSLVNPLVYAIRKRAFGAAFYSVFARCFPLLSKVNRCCPDSKVYPQSSKDNSIESALIRVRPTVPFHQNRDVDLRPKRPSNNVNRVGVLGQRCRGESRDFWMGFKWINR